jgi:hypothetical protein
MVQDQYYKKGLAINTDLRLEKQAKNFSLNAQISIDANSQLLMIRVTGNQSFYDSMKSLLPDLTLHFYHPTQSKHDHSFRLTPTLKKRLESPSNTTQAIEWIAPMNVFLNPSHWHVRLLDHHQTWQLQSRWKSHFNKNHHFSLKF